MSGPQAGCLSRGASLAALVTLGRLRAEVGAGSIQYEAHLLDSVASPMVRALPAYERDFRSHLLRARAAWEASQSRLRDAEQLLSELVSLALWVSPPALPLVLGNASMSNAAL